MASASRKGGESGKPAGSRFSRARLRAFHLFHLASRPMTLGVRGLVFDAEGRVLLVRHTYVPGWYMPGGGVDPGETAAEALRRELVEEAGIELVGEPALLGVFFNRTASRRDHVLLYRAGAFARRDKEPDREIAEIGFFAPGALPENTTPATRRRLRELAGGATPDPFW